MHTICLTNEPTFTIFPRGQLPTSISASTALLDFELWPRSISHCKKKGYYMSTDGIHFYTWELVLLFHKDVSTINHLIARQHLTYLLISYTWEVVNYKYDTDLLLGNLISHIIHRINHPNWKNKNFDTGIIHTSV